eukprot:sb/3478244/
MLRKLISTTYNKLPTTNLSNSDSVHSHFKFGRRREQRRFLNSPSGPALQAEPNIKNYFGNNMTTELLACLSNLADFGRNYHYANGNLIYFQVQVQVQINYTQ